MNTSGPTLQAPVWAADFGSRDHLVPGGAKILASAFSLDANGRRFIASGTAVGRTIAERDASTAFGPLAVGDAEVFLVYHDVANADDINDIELYRPGSVVKENFLPGFAGLIQGVKDLIRATYLCTRGSE